MLRMMQNDLVSIFARDTTFHHVLLVGGKTDMCVDPDIPHRIAQCGGLDAAVAAAAHEAEPGGLSALLAAKAELAERRNPALKSARLRRRADWTATAAERALRHAADDLGRAAGLFRDGRAGEDLYRTLVHRGHAAEARADRLLKDRMALLEEAASLESCSANADALARVAGS
jgi:hypothetical protein